MKASREFRKMVKGIVCFAIIPAVVILPLISTAVADDLKSKLQKAWESGQNSVTLTVSRKSYTREKMRAAFIQATKAIPLSVMTDRAGTRYVITFTEGERFVVYLNGRNPIVGRNAR